MTHGKLRRVGSLWKPKPGGRSLGSGSITIGGQRQRFVILRNDRKQGHTQPDYLLMSSEPPEPDPFTRRHATPDPARMT
jgi:hypothetical protein